jgi:phage shock protein C
MFCGRCGSELGAGARFCSACGAPVAGAATWPGGTQASGTQPIWSGQGPATRLERPRTNRMVAGVCAGLAQHYRWDLTWTRVLTVLIAVLSSGAGVVAYIVFWIVMPEQPWMLPASAPTPPPPPAV